jgi:hypothetical protein
VASYRQVDKSGRVMRRIDTSHRSVYFVRAMRLPDVCWEGSHAVGACFVCTIGVGMRFARMLFIEPAEVASV